MPRRFKSIGTIILLVIILYGILLHNPYYELGPETVQDYSRYKYHKDRWDAKNEIIDGDNEWIQLCKDDMRSCTPQEKEKELIPHLPRSDYLTPWLEDRPLFPLTCIIWVVYLLLIYCIYDTIFPRLYTINERRDRTYQGRMRYTTVDISQRRSYLAGNPGKISAWIRMYRTDTMRSCNIITSKGVIRIDHADTTVHRWKPHANLYEIWAKQLEWDDNGLLYPGDSTWATHYIDTQEVKRIIDEELHDTEEMVRRGTKTNHAVRQRRYLDLDEDGQDLAEEMMLDSANHDRGVQYEL